MWPLYYRYWGKAKPSQEGGASYHLLVYHCLDVAATGEALIDAGLLDLAPLARELNMDIGLVIRLAIFFKILHDLGKFARAFQNLAPDLSPQLVPANKSRSPRAWG